MKVKLENIDKNLVRLEIESAPELIEEGLAYSFKKNAKSFRINGFRPGKAPRKVVEQIYGKEVLYNDAMDYVIGRDYYAAIEELKLDVVSDPQKIDVKEFNAAQAIYTVDVYVKPEVKLGAYKALEVTEVAADVSDEDVDKAVEEEAKKNARTITVDDRAAALDDTVVIDFEGSVDGVPFEGGKGENFSLKLGSGQFIPGFEEQLVGIESAGETVVQVTFPEDYHAAELAGKAAEFKVKVHEIKKEEIPAIDDAFASDISEFETLAAYKEDLKQKMVEKKTEEAKHAMHEEALKTAINNAEIDIPECMIQASQEQEVRRMEQQLSMYGMNMAQYCQYMGVTVEEFKERVRPQAEINVRRDLVLEAIVAVEKIEATQEEIDKEFEEAAEYMKKPVEEVKALYAANTDAVIRDIQLRKASELITDSAVAVAEKKAPAKKAAAKTTTAKKAPAKKVAGEKAEDAETAEKTEKATGTAKKAATGTKKASTAKKTKTEKAE